MGISASATNDLVSVVMPVYNADQYIREALQSISAQSFENFEVIIVDDGSTDGSVSIIEEFCRADSRFRLIRKSHQGVCAARNRGVAEANGSWIALCDADDVWLDDKLARQVAFVRQSEGRFSAPLIVVGTCGYRIGRHGKVIDKFEPCGMHAEEDYLALRREHRIIYMLNSSVLFRRDVFEAVGGYRLDYDVGQDVDLFLRMAPFGIMLNIPDMMTLYRVHETSASTRKFVRQSLNAERSAENARRRALGQAELTYDGYVKLLQREGRYRQHMRTLRSWHFYRNAGSALAGGHYLRGLWLMTRSFMIQPGGLVNRVKKRVVVWRRRR